MSSVLLYFISQELIDEIMLYLDPKDIRLIGQENVSEYIWFTKKDGTIKQATLYNNIIGIKYLVKLGADIHEDNDIALQWSAANGYIDIVKYLIEHGADIAANYNYALRWSVKFGHIEVVKYLVKNGVDINLVKEYADFITKSSVRREIRKFLIKER